MNHTEEIRHIFKSWQRGLCPGGQVRVVQKGKVIFDECFGYSDLERSVLVDGNTVFHVASVSKQITCMCALLLYERGIIDVCADIRQYIPDLVSFEEPVTVLDMMNNISGIRDQWELQLYSGVRMSDHITQRDLLTLSSRQKSLNFPPRTKYMYSNTNFTFVSEIISRAAGMSLNEFAAINIFRPLEMTRTFIRERYDDIVMNRALSYVDRGDGHFLWKTLNFSNDGATSLHTTAADFVKWLETFRKPVICKPETRDMMLTVPTLCTEEKTCYACGLMVDTYNGYDFGGRRLITHSGADEGYRSVVLTFPDEALDIVIFSNTENIVLDGAAYQIAALLLDAKKADGRESDGRLFQDGFCGTHGLEGCYTASGVDTVFHASKAGEDIVLSYDDKKEVFRHSVGNRYASLYLNNELYLQENGATISFSHGAGLKLEPCETAVFSDEERECLPGVHYSGEVESAYEILDRDGTLVMRHKRLGEAEILQLSDGVYLCPLELPIRFKIKKDAGGEITGITVVGNRVAELVFTK